ncbi:MAG: hypothetical protein RRY95_00915 [Oscillospiraceae bacterium]
MLTLKKPLQLHIGQPLPTVSEELYERITGNYGLLRMHIAPKELLFFLSNPPELPEDLGGITSLSFQNTSVDNRAVTMDVVNNVVNRILLSDQQSFTYQDSVYLQTVLNKLGVTDVDLFMREVRNLKDEHHSVTELISLYEQELKLREKAAPTEERQASPPPPAPAAGELHTERTAWFLQNAIYQRLHTAEIYEMVHAFQREQTQNTYRNSELKTAEQLGASRFLTLRELRERAVPGGGVTLLHSVNHFELGDILPPPRTETEVLSQAATAALLATVEHVLVQEQTNRQERTAAHWLSLETALFETTQNTILRFQSQHDSETVHSNHWDAGESRTLTALHNQREILRELRAVRQTQTVLQTRTDSHLTERLTLEQRRLEQTETVFPPEGEPGAVTHNTMTEKQTERLERSLRTERERLSGETPPIQPRRTETTDAVERLLSLTYASNTVEPGTVLSRETEKQVIRQGERETIAKAKRSHTPTPLPTVPTKAPITTVITEHLTHKTMGETQRDVQAWSELLRETVLRERGAEPVGQELLSREKSDSTVTDTVHQLRERFTQTIQTPAEGGDIHRSFERTDGVRLTQLGDATYLSEQLHTVEETRTETTSPVEIDHPVSDREAEPAVLAREVQEIERRNRERFAAAQTLRAGQLAQTVAPPDLKKIRLDALRALDAPDGLELLREALPPEGIERAGDSRTEAYLAAADAQTRSLFEAVLRYEQNPADPAAERILHPGSVGEFNAVTMELPVPGAEGESHSETLRLTRENETLLEQLTETPPVVRSVVRETAPPVSIIYKREETAFSEELLERWEQERKQVKISKTSSEEITTHQSSQVVENQVSTQVITQSAEEIQRLVNQTLSKQMNAISDKVYHQMEKRLQTERSRRGRF